MQKFRFAKDVDVYSSNILLRKIKCFIRDISYVNSIVYGTPNSLAEHDYVFENMIEWHICYFELDWYGSSIVSTEYCREKYKVCLIPLYTPFSNIVYLRSGCG